MGNKCIKWWSAPSATGEIPSKPAPTNLLPIPRRLAELKSLLPCEMLGRMWCLQFLSTSELILEKNNNHHTIVGVSVHWPLAWLSHVHRWSPYTAALDFRTLFQTFSHVEKSQNTVFPRHPTSNMGCMMPIGSSERKMAKQMVQLQQQLPAEQGTQKTEMGLWRLPRKCSTSLSQAPEPLTMPSLFFLYPEKSAKANCLHGPFQALQTIALTSRILYQRLLSSIRSELKAYFFLI